MDSASTSAKIYAADLRTDKLPAGTGGVLPPAGKNDQGRACSVGHDSYHDAMTADPHLAAAGTAQPAGCTNPERRHALTYRPTHNRYEWLRRQAFDQRKPMQTIIDEALDLLRAHTGRPTP